MIPALASSGPSVASVAGPPTATTCPARSGLRYGNSGRRTGRLATASNPVVSSAVPRGCSSEDDLHHRSYSRLGHEGSRDLIPLCRNCHMALHRVLEFDRSWRRLDRAQATDLIVKALRRKGARHRWVSQETLDQRRKVVGDREDS